jgi:hypothetical protein
MNKDFFEIFFFFKKGRPDVNAAFSYHGTKTHKSWGREEIQGMSHS